MSEYNPVSLMAGIRLIGDDVERFRTDGSVELSSGIVPAQAQYPLLPYWEHAFVPKLPWRKPTRSELDVLLDPVETAQPGRWVQITRIPVDVVSLFEPARTASQYPTDQKLREYTASSECRAAIQQTNQYASTLTWPDHPQVDRGGIFFKACGLPTTTPRNYPELLGLHIDSAYKQVPFNDRKYAPGRVSINLGLNDRFLLFVSVSVDQIHQLLADRNIPYRDEPVYATHQFRAAFMSNFPDVPVVKVRVRPGEAYFAPTENMIHDGCTAGQVHFDVQFSACAHFRPQCSIDHASAALLSARLRRNETASPLQVR